MNTKKIFVMLFVFGLLVSPAFGNAQQNRQGEHEPGTGLEDQNEMSASRRSRVANAVQEMERIATRNQGIGDQIRVVARNQNRIQEEAESALQTAQKRGGFSRFFVGPNYGQLKNVENRLENHNQNLAELKELKNQIQNSEDVSLLDQQINTMEEIKTELEEAVSEDQKGFSLFGWLNRMFTR